MTASKYPESMSVSKSSIFCANLGGNLLTLAILILSRFIPFINEASPADEQVPSTVLAYVTFGSLYHLSIYYFELYYDLLL